MTDWGGFVAPGFEEVGEVFECSDVGRLRSLPSQRHASVHSPAPLRPGVCVEQVEELAGGMHGQLACQVKEMLVAGDEQRMLALGEREQVVVARSRRGLDVKDFS